MNVGPQTPEGPQGKKNANGEGEEDHRNTTSNIGQDLKHQQVNRWQLGLTGAQD